MQRACSEGYTSFMELLTHMPNFDLKYKLSTATASFNLTVHYPLNMVVPPLQVSFSFYKFTNQTLYHIK